MKKIKLNIPSSKNKNLVLQIYRSTKASDIDSVVKIKKLQPIMTLREKLMQTKPLFDGRLGYEIFDMEQIGSGINYIGPEPNPIPADVYEATVVYDKLSDYIYRPSLKLTPMEIKNDGTMYYYSIVGLNEEANTLTNVSLVKGVLMNQEYHSGYRDIWVKEDDKISKIGSVPWKKDGADHKDIIIGMGDTDVPMIPINEVVPKFPIDEVEISTKNLLYQKCVDILIPNIWNKEEYQTRTLKEFAVTNVIEEKSGIISDFSYPNKTAVDIECIKLIIQDLDDPSKEPYEVNLVKQFGLFYKKEFDDLSVNPFEITCKNGVFSKMIREAINVVVPVELGKNYELEIKIIDTFNLISESVKKTFKGVRI